MTADGTWSDESEWEFGEEQVGDEAGEAAGPPPVVAVVGRPNVGKSTLVNRILGRREAVVQDLPGVTRDRVSYDALWSGRRFVVQDTGGWEPDAKGLQQKVAELVLQVGQVATLDGVGHLIGLLDGVGGDGGEGLLEVPRAAAVGVAQAGHDLE